MSNCKDGDFSLLISTVSESNRSAVRKCTYKQHTVCEQYAGNTFFGAANITDNSNITNSLIIGAEIDSAASVSSLERCL